MMIPNVTDPLDKRGLPCFRVGSIVEPLVEDAEARVKIRRAVTIVERICGPEGFSHYIAVDADGERYEIRDQDDPRLAATSDPPPPSPRAAVKGGKPSP